MGQLIVAKRRLGARRVADSIACGFAFGSRLRARNANHGFFSLRIGRRHQPQLAVEDAQQRLEVTGTVRVTGRGLQVRLGPHVALDGGARLGQQRLQHGPSRSLVQPVGRWGGRRAEGLLQERHPHAADAADRLQGGRRPRLP